MGISNVSTLVDLLRVRAYEQAGREIYTFLVNGENEGDRVTYAELDRQARAVGTFLQNYCTPRERVLLLYPPGLEFIAAFFGCLYAGVIAVPAYPPRNRRYLPRIQAIAEDSQARVWLTVEKTLSRIQSWLEQTSGFTAIQLLRTDNLTAGLEENWQEAKLDSQDVAFLQYTSGSTALPKGVMVTHGNLLWNLKMIQQAFELTPESLVVSWLPPYHDMGLIGGILEPFFAGFPVVLMAPAAFLQRPLRWLQAISRYRATSSGGPNFAYDLCVSNISSEQRDDFDLSSWDLAFNGSEPVRPETLKRFANTFKPYGFRKEAFYPGYGLAEATLFVSGGKKSELPVIRSFRKSEMKRHRVAESSENTEDDQKLVGCGQSVPEQTIAIVDPELLTRCAPEQIGEIWISGPGVAQGYWNRPDITQVSFQAYLADTGEEPVLSEVEGPFLRTGDLGFLKDGELFITGRMKDLIIIRGRNHYPQDIEQTVEQSHPAIRRNSSAAFSTDIAGEERLIIVAELERRYRRRSQQSEDKDNLERRQPQDLDQAEIEPGFTPTISYPPDILECLKTIRETVAEHHGLQVYAIFLIKATTIPRTSSGKIQRHACRMRFQEGTLDALAEWDWDESQEIDMSHSGVKILTSEASSSSLTSPPEGKLPGAWDVFIAHLWARELNIDWTVLNRETHFFQLGGDSLHATTLTGAFSDALGVELDPDLLYQYPTLGALATYFEQEYGVPPTGEIKNTLLSRYRKHCRPECNEFPLLPLQQSFFIGRVFGDIAIYVVLDIELKGELDIPRFQEAIQLLVGRHPALRLAFKTNSNGPIQHVVSPDNSRNVVRFRDLSGLTSQERRGCLEEEFEVLSHYTFDNTAGETFQANVFTINPQTHRLLMNFDHLAIDGFSLTKVFEDLHRIYSQLLQGKTVAEIPQTTLSFKEYVEIYTARQDFEQRERDIAYWMEKFSTHEPFPPIGDNDSPGDAEGFEGHFHRLEPVLVKQLQEHACTYGLTFFSILMASFFKLLALWTDSQHLTINTPYLNRRPYSHDVQEILGCFTDILPIRAEHIPDESLLSLARNIHQSLAELHHHGSISGVDIARLLAQKHQTNPEAVSPVIFSSALFPLEEVSSAWTYTFSSIWVRTGAPATWLDVVVYEAGNKFICSWNYLRRKFSPQKIILLATQYESILQDFAKRPQHADPLRVLLQYPDFASWYEQRQQQKEHERHLALVTWNDTKVDYPLENCIHELFEMQAAQTPDAVALIFEDRQMSYAELNAKANQLAHHLRSLGVGPEVLVGISIERSFEMLIGLLGILKAGGAYVPMDPEYPKDRLTFMLEDSQVSVLLTQEKLKLETGNWKLDHCNIICLDSDWETIARERDNNPVSGVRANNLIYVIYTSGSTGKPKGAMNIHRALVNRLLWMQDTYQLTPEDRVLQKTPFSFDVSGWEFWWPLITGSRLVIAKPGGHKDSSYLVDLIQQQKITIMHFVPPMLQVFLKEQGVEQCPSLRQVICSGEALPHELQERFFERLDAELDNLYGPTEAAIDVTFWRCQREGQYKIVPIGRPIANTQIYILDQFLQPVPVGMPGELHIGGVNLARGYLNRPELTRVKFIPNPFSDNSEDRLYKTGDLVRYLPDGNIEYLGRLDHQVKIRGFRIELGEIEAVLTSHSEVRETVVLAREDYVGEKRLVAYLVPVQQPGPSMSELRHFLKEILPEYMVPSAFVSLDAFPLSPNGKIDRRALPAPETVRSASEAILMPPQNQMEQRIANVWQEILHLDKIGIHESFFELGGHSLLAVQIHNRLQETFGQEISIVELFQYPTIHSLAKFLSQKFAEPNFSGTEVEKRKTRSTRRGFMEQRRQARRQHRTEKKQGGISNE